MLDRLSIRVRITVGTLLIAAAFFGGASLLVHREVESVLDDATATVLAGDVGTFLIELRDEPDQPVDAPANGELIAVIDPAGAVAVSTLPDALADQLDRVDLTRSTAQTVTIGSETYRVLVASQQNAAGTWTVIAARTDAASDAILDNLTRGLLVGLVALTVIFAAASWLLTGAALRPIVRLRRSAEQLAATPTDELLPEGPARDEVSDLAVTLNALIVQLRSAAEREKQLVSDASHELRTPLAILRAQLELIRTGEASDADDILAAERAAARMAELVANLLELSRLESTQNRSSSTVAEAAAQLGEAIDRARFAARATAVSIEYSVDAAPDEARSMQLSPHDIGRIVDNLVSNARRALGDSGSIVATLAVEGDQLVLAVVDDGPGIPEAFIERALDRFSQQDDGRAGGTGLGLAIVAAAARQAGGTVALSNRATGGLIARVALPLGSAGESAAR